MMGVRKKSRSRQANSSNENQMLHSSNERDGSLGSNFEKPARMTSQDSKGITIIREGKALPQNHKSLVKLRKLIAKGSHASNSKESLKTAGSRELLVSKD